MKRFLILLLFLTISLFGINQIKAYSITSISMFTIDDLYLFDNPTTHDISINSNYISLPEGYDYLIMNNKSFVDNCDYALKYTVYDNYNLDGYISFKHIDDTTQLLAFSVMDNEFTHEPTINRGAQNLFFDLGNNIFTHQYVPVAYLQGYSSGQVITDVEFSISTTYNSVSNPAPSGLLESFVSEFSQYFLFTSNIQVVSFYNGNYLWNIQYLSSESAQPYAPQNPPEKTGYTFIGWATIDGDTFNFDISKLDYTDYNSDGEIELHAHYVYTGVTTDGLPSDISTNLPTGLGRVLSMIGLNNSGGYIILFLLLNLPILAFVLLKNKSQSIILFSSVIILIIFIVFGLLPLWFDVMMILIFISLLLNKYVIRGAE